MNEPATLAAIDAGSNAIRIVVAEAHGPGELVVLARERAPVRLGRRAFTRRNFDRATIDLAVSVFEHFRMVMDRFQVRRHRAVATSAARNARNRENLVSVVRRKTGLKLDVIDGAEEARLVREAVLAALPASSRPRVILDLGGGSAEFNLLREASLEYAATIPIGAVRLMEMFDAGEALSEGRKEAIRTYVRENLQASLPRKPRVAGGLVVACGGNAEALARVVSGEPGQIETSSDGSENLTEPPRPLDLRILARELDTMLDLDARGRIERYSVRRDRADVMAIAALVLTTIGEYLGTSELLVPGVGVRDGILRDLVREHYHVQRTVGARERAKTLLAASRDLALRYRYDDEHSEHVRRIAKRLFDQLAPLHRLGRRARLQLELAALLHDVGQFVSYRAHQEHGAYLVAHSALPGLRRSERNMLACIVRCHGKVDPDRGGPLFADLTAAEKRQVRAITALLRVADGLDGDHRQTVEEVETKIAPGRVVLQVRGRQSTALAVWGAKKKDELFEQVFRRKLVVKESEG